MQETLPQLNMLVQIETVNSQIENHQKQTGNQEFVYVFACVTHEVII